MDVLDLERKLLAVRAGLAARAALCEPTRTAGAPVVFDVALWDGANAAADLLAVSFEPGTPLAVGVHELVRTGRVGGYDVTVSSWVVVGEPSEAAALPRPVRQLAYRPNLRRQPIPDPVEAPPTPWADSLPEVIRLPALSPTRLTRELRQLADAGDRALAILMEQFAPLVHGVVSRRRAVIERNPAFGLDDARACLEAELAEVLLRFASTDRPNATILRTLRFALPNRLDAVLGRVDRAHTGSAENAEIRLFVRKHHELERMPDELRADGEALAKLRRTLADRIGVHGEVEALTAIRHAEDVQWSITWSRAQRAAAAQGEQLAAGWRPTKHRFSVAHICEALARQVSVVSLDRPVGTEAGEDTALHELVAGAPEQGFAAVESRDLVLELVTPLEDHSLEALVVVLGARRHTDAELAELLTLHDPAAARQLAATMLPQLLPELPPALQAEVRAVLDGVDLTELEREVFLLRSGLTGDELAWDEVCSRTDLALQYRSKTAAETRARAVLRRAEALVRGRAALSLPMPATRRVELLRLRAEALASPPYRPR